MKTIPLSKGYEALVDDIDFQYLSLFKWYVRTSRPNSSKYACRVDKKGKTLYMHRIILNATKETQVDHKDRNGLNNIRENLRIASRSQNAANSCKRLSKIPYRGVELDTRHGNFKYRARIRFNGKKINLGSFCNAIDAAMKYDKKALELFGEFATLNFPNTYKGRN